MGRRSVRLAVVSTGSVGPVRRKGFHRRRQRPQAVEEVEEVFGLIEPRALVADALAVRERLGPQRRHLAIGLVPRKQERFGHDRKVDRLRMQAWLAPGGGEGRRVRADDEAAADRDRLVAIDRLEHLDDEASCDRVGGLGAKQRCTAQPSGGTGQDARFASEVLPPERREVGLRGKHDRLRHERRHQEGLDREASLHQRSLRLRRFEGEDRLFEGFDLPLDAISHEAPRVVVGGTSGFGVEGVGGGE